MSHAKPLRGKVAIITGGARGMGAATAEEFVAQGAKVVITDVLDGSTVAHRLGANAAFLRHDVSDELGWSTVITQTLKLNGRLDVLVNNAGVLRVGAVQDTDVSAMDQAFRVNQLGTFLGMKAVLGTFKAAGAGSIINMSSCVATRGVAGQFAYAASKWAVRGMTKCAALELAAFKIRVNSVNPGPIDTPLMEAYSKDQKAAIETLIPWGGWADLKKWLAQSRFSPRTPQASLVAPNWQLTAQYSLEWHDFYVSRMKSGVAKSTSTY